MKRPDTAHLQRRSLDWRLLEGRFGVREGQRPREGQEPTPSPPSHGSDALPASGQRSTASLIASCPLRPRHGAWSAQGNQAQTTKPGSVQQRPGPKKPPRASSPPCLQ